MLDIININDFLEIFKNKSFYTLLGIDFGIKKIGIAISYSESNMAVPLKTIGRKNIEQDYILLSQIIKEYKIDGVVIGLPLNLNGEESESSRICREFFNKFNEKQNLLENSMPTVFEDERFSTAIAHNIMKEHDMRRKDRENIDNEMAASVILDGFIQKLKNFKIKNKII